MSEESQRLAYPIRRTDPIELPAEYAKLRRDEPLCPVTFVTGDPALLVTRHQDVKTVLADRRFSRAAMCGEGGSRYQAVRPGPDSILSMDPPRHTRVCQLANHAFTARRVEQWRARIQEITDQLLDEMADMAPPVDLVTVFARPLPLRIICEILGLPLDDQDTFTGWTRRVMTLTSTAEEIVDVYVEMRAYVAQVVAEKRKSPGDDALSLLTTVSDEQGTLTDSEVIGLGTFLLVAGHDTSVTVLTDGALTVMRNPDQLELLRADPTLWPAAVEEVLRLNNPGGSIFPRVATTDVQLGDMVVPQGTTVVAHIGSGCRDEGVLADPDRFDVRRQDAGFQIFFGHGPHFCLGAALGRVETEIGLRSLFDRFPTLSLAVAPERLRWQDLAALGGFAELPVTWERTGGGTRHNHS